MFRKTLLVTALFIVGCGEQEKVSDEPQQSHPNGVWDSGPRTHVECRIFFKKVPAVEYESVRKQVHEAAEAWSKKLKESEQIDVILVDIKSTDPDSAQVKAITKVLFFPRKLPMSKTIEEMQ